MAEQQAEKLRLGKWGGCGARLQFIIRQVLPPQVTHPFGSRSQASKEGGEATGASPVEAAGKNEVGPHLWPGRLGFRVEERRAPGAEVQHSVWTDWCKQGGSCAHSPSFPWGSGCSAAPEILSSGPSPMWTPQPGVCTPSHSSGSDAPSLSKLHFSTQLGCSPWTPAPFVSPPSLRSPLPPSSSLVRLTLCCQLTRLKSFLWARCKPEACTVV